MFFLSNVTKPDSKLVGNKSGKINDGNRTVISNDKRNEIHATLDAQKTKNENLLSKKLKMENMINPNSSVEKLTKNSKNVENLTLGLAGTLDKKKGNNIKGTVKVVSPVYKGIKSVNGSPSRVAWISFLLSLLITVLLPSFILPLLLPTSLESGLVTLDFSSG
jgi:hypothetical protein